MNILNLPLIGTSKKKNRPCPLCRGSYRSNYSGSDNGECAEQTRHRKQKIAIQALRQLQKSQKGNTAKPTTKEKIMTVDQLHSLLGAEEKISTTIQAKNRSNKSEANK